jgi:GNAT superfamily N-acetyltransferase
MDVTVDQAAINDLADLAPLFDGYRQFYGRPSDLDLAQRFLSERLRNQDSTIFIARDAQRWALGFTQLFPSFTSTGCARIYILNDLFVTPEQRGKQVGVALLRAAEAFGRSQGAVRLSLSTAHDNQRAQAVYAALGWKRDSAFFTYNLVL